MALLDWNVGVIVAGRLFARAPVDARQPVVRQQQLHRPIDRRTSNWATLATQVIVELLGAKRLGIAHDSFQDSPARLGDPVSLIAQVGQHVLNPRHSDTPLCLRSHIGSESHLMSRRWSIAHDTIREPAAEYGTQGII